MNPLTPNSTIATIMIKAVIVDDEQHSLKILHRQLKDSGRVEVCAKFTDALEALGYLMENTVDVVFLDIEMPELSGLELVPGLHEKKTVVFVTAYPEYALEAFKINALDYIIKPVATERLNETLNRVSARLFRAECGEK